jgi:hypothetical protein
MTGYAAINSEQPQSRDAVRVRPTTSPVDDNLTHRRNVAMFLTNGGLAPCRNRASDSPVTGARHPPAVGAAAPAVGSSGRCAPAVGNRAGSL